MFVPPPTEDRRRVARCLYWQGWTVGDIAREFEMPSSSVSNWKGRDRWDDASTITRVETTIEARLVQLLAKAPKSGSDYKEIDLLGRQIERMARVRRFEAPGGQMSDLNPNRLIGPRKAYAKLREKQAKRNSYSEDQQAALRKIFDEELFDYQRGWYQAGQAHRIRNILKSRQIGATWFFAREALVDAMETGRNQIFLSASRAQANVFKQYIQQFAAAADVELAGDPIVLPNDAALYFLGTNARTAQSYHGNLYFDEYFWVFGFKTLRKVASGMAMHKKWRQTYFSTPSSLTHDAYPFWSGARAKGRVPGEAPELDTTHAALAAGALGPDGQWRQIVTVADAAAAGCDLFDVEQLRLEYSTEEFAQLLMCEFLDDSASVFPLASLQGCLVDSWELWSDFKPFAIRPYGQRAVWLGYDPNGGGAQGDSAGLVLVAPPDAPGGKFRVLHREQFRGKGFADQAAVIRKFTRQYNVTYMGIDVTGVGAAVYQLVRQFFPSAQAIRYSPETKSLMIQKALDVIGHGRLQFDAGWRDLVQSFMAIRRVLTASGRRVTYEVGRSEETSHSDIAWAVMHTLINEPLEGATQTNQSFMEIV